MPANDSVERTVYTARFPNSLYNWMRDEVRGTDQSLNDFIVQLATDFRDCHGLPAVMVESLTADRKALGLGRREYILHLLTRRYEQLMKNEPGFDGKQRGSRQSSITAKKSKA